MPGQDWWGTGSFPRKREPMTTDRAHFFPPVVMGPRLRGTPPRNAAGTPCGDDVIDWMVA
jgi:hypothetical protein